MSNKRYVVLADGRLHWVRTRRLAEMVYEFYKHARMEVWENMNDHNSARFIKKK